MGLLFFQLFLYLVDLTHCSSVLVWFHFLVIALVVIFIERIPSLFLSHSWWLVTFKLILLFGNLIFFWHFQVKVCHLAGATSKFHLRRSQLNSSHVCWASHKLLEAKFTKDCGEETLWILVKTDVHIPRDDCQPSNVNQLLQMVHHFLFASSGWPGDTYLILDFFVRYLRHP